MRKIHLLSLIAIFTFISACKKDSSIGADILPKDDLLNVKFSDTFTLHSKTLSDTFLRTDKLSKNYLGVIDNNSQFGFQKSSIVMELDRPSTVYDDTLGPFLLDSVVLLLKYNSVYGDTTVSQSFDVSTISNKIIETSTYYSNSNLFPGTGSIGSVSPYYFNPTNKVIVSTADTIGVSGILRVKLNQSFGDAILGLGQTILRDSSLFKNAFSGIIIENSTNNGKAMAEIDISSTFSSVVIYYKNKYGEKKDMRLYSSLLNNQNGNTTTRVNAINLFSNSLATDVQNTVISGLKSDSVNYLLGQGGTIVRLSLPTLTSLGKTAVNKAQIVISQIQQNSSNDFAKPLFLLLLKRNSSGNLDILSTSDGVGILDTTGTDGLGNKIARYNFTITKYVQAISKGSEINADLYIATYRSGGTDGTVNVLNSIINGSSINFGYIPSRVIIAGSNYSDSRYKMKLNLTYTVIK